VTLIVKFTPEHNADQYDFGHLIAPTRRPSFRPEQPWLLPDGRAVLEHRPLPSFKRTFVHLMVLHIFGSELRRWM